MGKAIMCGRVWVMASRCARCYKVVKVYSSLRETKQRNVALSACQSKSPTLQCEPGSTSLRMGVSGEHVVDVVRIISSLLPRESLVTAPQLDRMSPSVKLLFECSQISESARPTCHKLFVLSYQKRNQQCIQSTYVTQS